MPKGICPKDELFFCVFVLFTFLILHFMLLVIILEWFSSYHSEKFVKIPVKGDPFLFVVVVGIVQTFVGYYGI